jgi:hypothetical protein
MSHNHHPGQIENNQLSTLITQNVEIIRLLGIIAKEDAPPILTKIKVVFSKGTPMSAVVGPVTLTTAGQKATASVLGFDQNGQPWTGTMPAATFSSDDTAQAIVQFDPTTGQTTAVANGVANITATLTTAEGKALTDTEAVTVAIAVVPPPTPVLSSIKVAFDTGGAAGLAAAFRRS